MNGSKPIIGCIAVAVSGQDFGLALQQVRWRVIHVQFQGGIKCLFCFGEEVAFLKDT